MKTAIEVLDAFDNIRRAQRAGVYAPHKPLLILLALARVQRGEPRLVEFEAIDAPLKQLLTEFGPSSAPKSRHYPFWHLATDGQGAPWDLSGPREVLKRPAGATPNLGELREHHIKAGFPVDIDEALRHIPGLLQAVASRMLETYFPATLHADIVATLGLDLDGANELREGATAALDYTTAARRKRDPGFRDRVLRAYEYRCCVCGFDLRIGHMPAGLEAAHIQWHHVGGPDIETNGLSLCALHHKLFDLGVFTVEPTQHRVVFSQHAVSGSRGIAGEMQFHGRAIHAPQHVDLLPAPEFLAWNTKNVFKTPARLVVEANATPRAAH
ncbi:MAG: HNH endonuclease [Hydrogenophaga sp.]|jgi:putative restriction endonuclease|nr:HNH endonuclease [Hydrogenophaga sp.]